MTQQEFFTLAETHNVIPISKTFFADTLTPVSAFLRLREGSSSSFLFESVEGGERFARYSFIGRDPIASLRCKEKITIVQEKDATHTTSENFFDVVEDFLHRYTQPPLSHLPSFYAGLVGFIGYDAIRFIEDIPLQNSASMHFDESMLLFFSSVFIIDHFKHQITLVVNCVIEKEHNRTELYEQAQKKIAMLESLLLNANYFPNIFRAFPERIESEIAKEEFLESVNKAKEYIAAGDIFQVVLSQRFSMKYSGDVFDVYRALRIVNPSPYLYFLDFEGMNIIGSSPEILVRAMNGIAEVFPIAGTSPRGRTEEEDKHFEEQLLADEKERAEHIMLVDLGRNDLGRVCEIGSVKIDQLMNVVRYSHVMHIASRVAGKIVEEKNIIDVFRAVFPAGTVSGAPKIRAMEIIDELEKSRRGIYAGGVGYFDFSGNMDMCITIRTIVAVNGTMYFQSGAGIVADSDAEKEFEETMNKSRALFEAVKKAENVFL